MSTYNTGIKNINEKVTITGVGLFALTGVSFPGVGFIDFSYFDTSPEHVEFNVPESATFGVIKFSFISGTSQENPPYVIEREFFPIPRIDSVTPFTQEVGKFVAISGKSLSGVSYVSFNNITGTDIFYNEASGGLMVKVPSGYTTGPLRISGYNGSGTVSGISLFDFYGQISLNAFSAENLYEGDLLSISGQNFNLSYVNESSFMVYFPRSTEGNEIGLVSGSFTGSNDKISGIIPQDALSGYVFIKSKDDTSFTSKSGALVLNIPSVIGSLRPFLGSGDSNIIFGRGFSNVTGVTLSGLNYRKPKNISNSGVVTQQVSPFTGALNNRSMYLSGGSHLNVESVQGGDFEFGTGDFTIEFWMNPTYHRVDRVDLINDVAGFYFGKLLSSGAWNFSAAGESKVYIPTGNMPTGIWTKIAISRTGLITQAYAINSGASYLNSSTGSVYHISGGSGLYIGALNAGHHSTSGHSNYSGYLKELRITKGRGLYNASVIPDTGTPLFDETGTVLFLQGQRSRFDTSGNRNSLSGIPFVSGTIEDYNFGLFNNSYSISGFAKNFEGTTILFTGSGLNPGTYDVTLHNQAGRNFLFKNFQTITTGPIIKNTTASEGYAGGEVDLEGFAFYNSSEVFFRNVETGSLLKGLASRDVNYLNYQSTYRKPKDVIFNSGNVTGTTSYYDDRSILLSGLSSYLSFTLTGDRPLTFGKSFTFEMDFKPLFPNDITGDKFLIGTRSGINLFICSNNLVISGINFNISSSGKFSGAINPNHWNHISISKTFIGGVDAFGKILLNNSGIYMSGDDSVDYSNADFSLNNDLNDSGDLQIYVGRDAAGTSSSHWSGYVDEIFSARENYYSTKSYRPFRRRRNNSNTEILIHANAGLFDDNANDFGFSKVTLPSLYFGRKADIIIDNEVGEVTGLSAVPFTLLGILNITGSESPLIRQGQSWTGYGSNFHYINSIQVGDQEVTGFSVQNQGDSEFDQRLTLTMPDLASSGDLLTIGSDYYSYTYPFGLPVHSGVLADVLFSPLTGVAGTSVSMSGKFLNTVTSILLGRDDSSKISINTFSTQTITELIFSIPNVYDIVNGPITLMAGNSGYLTSQSLTFINPSINLITPQSAYYGDNILLAGVSLSGLEFYGKGFSGENILFPTVSAVGGTGAIVTVPRDIRISEFKFFSSGFSILSGAGYEVLGFSKVFNPSVTISGSDFDVYRSRSFISITGINAYQNSAKDLYISGFNLLNNQDGQFPISQSMSPIDISTLQNYPQPYTGYTVLYGGLNIENTTINSASVIDGSDPYPLGEEAPANFTVDGFIGSGKLMFLRNSFDAERLFKTVTIKCPLIENSGLNILTGSVSSLITIEGRNLNYVTGIKFKGAGMLLIGATGSEPFLWSVYDQLLDAGASSGILQTVDASSLNSNLIYKDSSTLQFYPPSMIGKGLHSRDVEDIRVVSGVFSLMTYLNEEYPISGIFNYIPLISITDMYINNNLNYRDLANEGGAGDYVTGSLPYNPDGTSSTSGYDGSLISFKGQGLKNATGIDFLRISNGVILERAPSTFNLEKKKFEVYFINSANGVNGITGYNISDEGKGYTSGSVNIGMSNSTTFGSTTYSSHTYYASGHISMIPPYVGMLTGVSIFGGLGSASFFSGNAWSGDSMVTVPSPDSGFIVRAPVLIFTGVGFDVIASGIDDDFIGSYTISTTFPLHNSFRVGDLLDVEIKNAGSSFQTSSSPFLKIQNPNNSPKITDIVLTGSYVGIKTVTLPYSSIFVTNESFYDDLDMHVKTIIMYPTGYQDKRFVVTTTSASSASKNLIMNLSSSIPATGSYLTAVNPIDSDFLRLRLEIVDVAASMFGGLGGQSSQATQNIGQVGAGSTMAGVGIGSTY